MTHPARRGGKDDDFLTLGIETSCDETSVAVLRGGNRLLSNSTASQVETHAPFGGVVPELAARRHEANLNPLLKMALEEAGASFGDISLIGVTTGPGLAVSLAVGIACARAISSLTRTPCVGVSHLMGHMLANLLDMESPVFPAVSLIVSGGHTELFYMRSALDYERLGGTVDDAAGEAFDKIARFLGLGYPGGPAIEAAAAKAGKSSVRFPRPMLGAENFDFSFSGLKTAVINHVKERGRSADPFEIAFAFEDAVATVLTEKTVRAAAKTGVTQAYVSGGVAANRMLREKMRSRCDDEGIALHIPPPLFCTDNAAMIAKAAFELYTHGRKGHPLTPAPNLLI
ncbi:MAG: tRNA (adenosine(37)-N6)-threonylcarbamoyltransferase complex transferase subunit TsaD [bacterium]